MAKRAKAVVGCLVATGLAFLLGACGPGTIEVDSYKFSDVHGELVACADGPTVDGIDVSYHNGTINWDAVADSGIEFAFIRVSDGIYIEDPQFERNWSEARRVGIVRGVYQFFRPQFDPIAQADLLLDKMGTLEDGDLPPVIDVERDGELSPSQVTARIHQWVDHVEAATGRTPIIYTGYYIWRDDVGSNAFANHPLWIAQYGPVCPNIPDAWSRWTFFQTTDRGTVPGIQSMVDMDLFNGDIEGLYALANGAPSPDDPPGDDPPGDDPPDDDPPSGDVPAAPTGLDETIAGDAVTMSCYPVGGATGYDFEIEFMVNGSFTTYYSYSAASNSKTFCPQTDDTTYRWRVRAKNGYGAGGWSTWSTFDFGNVSGGNDDPPDDDPPSGDVPATPTGLDETISGDSVTMSCNPVSGATGYEFEIEFMNNGSFTSYYSYSVASNAKTFCPQNHDTTYRWRVRARNGYGVSDSSSWSTFDFD